MKTTLQKVFGVRRLLENPTNWLKWYLAQDQHRQSIGPKDECASKFCLLGAMIAVSEGDRYVYYTDKDLEHAMNEAGGFRNTSDLVRFNNHPITTHKDILNLIDRVIANLESQSVSATTVQ